MPYQDGYTICREIRKQSDIPIIVLTSRNTDFDEFIDENTRNVNIVRLRKKLSEIGAPDYLETKRGLGYKV